MPLEGRGVPVDLDLGRLSALPCMRQRGRPWLCSARGRRASAVGIKSPFRQGNDSALTSLLPVCDAW